MGNERVKKRNPPVRRHSGFWLGEAQRLRSARTNAPPDHVGDSDGLDPAIGGELESIRMRRIDPHRDTRPSVLYEELARRVRVNPQVATLIVDRELLPPVLEPRRRRGLCHLPPPSRLVDPNLNYFYYSIEV